MSSLFDNADTFLNANSDLFDGLSESDLIIPERLIFLKGEIVQGVVLDAAIIEKIGAVKLEVKIIGGEHDGKIHEVVNFKPKEKDGKISAGAKKSWVEFLLAFFTKEEILSKKVDFNKLIGQTVEFKAGEARPSGEKIYQNYNAFKLVEAQPF